MAEITSNKSIYKNDFGLFPILMTLKPPWLITAMLKYLQFVLFAVGTVFSVVSPISSMFLKVSSGNNSNGIRWPVKNPRRSGKLASKFDKKKIINWLVQNRKLDPKLPVFLLDYMPQNNVSTLSSTLFWIWLQLIN